MAAVQMGNSQEGRGGEEGGDIELRCPFPGSQKSSTVSISPMFNLSEEALTEKPAGKQRRLLTTGIPQSRKHTTAGTVALHF